MRFDVITGNVTGNILQIHMRSAKNLEKWKRPQLSKEGKKVHGKTLQQIIQELG